MKWALVVGLVVLMLGGCSLFSGIFGGNASFRVQNNSSYTIFYLYVSPSSVTTWGSDQLGLSTIAPGASFTLNNLTPGNYDSKVTDSSDSWYREYYGWSFVAGTTTTWNVTN